MKFNQNNPTVYQKNLTTNFAGGEAYQQSKELELISVLLTSMVNDQFYRTAGTSLDNFETLITQVDPKFAAKAAIYARQEMGMRSITHVSAANIAHIVKGEEWTREFLYHVVRRVDDITEILAYYLKRFGSPIPNSMKKGLGRAFSKFDRYQLAKYQAKGKEVALIDAVNLLHPKPNEKNREALALLVKDKLIQENTWEDALSGTKGNIEAKKEVWTSLLKENRLGYLALLKNLRNIYEQAPEYVPLACEQLVNPDAIHKSLVMPFRFLTAMEELKTVREYSIAISKALDISMDNVPRFDGSTLVVLDVSGSMTSCTDDNTKSPARIGSLFAAVLYKTNNADFMTFDRDAYYVYPNPADSVMTIANCVDFRGGSTNFHSIFRKANKKYDRVVILSDMQGWVGYETPVKDFREYCKLFRCNPYIYSWDLQGYGTMEFPEEKVFCLAGFNSEVFNVMKVLETNRTELIDKINRIEL